MMKKIIFTIITCLIITMAHAQEYKTYTSEDTAYTVVYPDNWAIESNGFGKRMLASFAANKINASDKRSPAFVGFSRELLRPGVTTLDGALKPMIAPLKKAMGLASYLENKRIGNKHTLVYESKVKDKKLKSKMVMWLHGNYMYVATYGAETKDYNSYLKVADGIVNSIIILKD
jgi:hypothetical protein